MGERATPFELDGPRGSIPCVLHEAADEDGGIAVVLPGLVRAGGRLGGSPARTKLAFPTALLRTFGLSVLELWWEPEEDEASLGAATVKALRHARERRSLEVVVAASQASVPLARLGDERQLATVWVTPLLLEAGFRDAIERAGSRAFVVGGSADPHYDLDAVDGLRAAGAHVVVLEGADHALVVADPVASARLLAGWIAELRGFLSTALAEQACRPVPA
jgi:pimeloyl-ACP methyl ester carboxylesterase